MQHVATPHLYGGLVQDGRPLHFALFLPLGVVAVEHPVFDLEPSTDPPAVSSTSAGEAWTRTMSFEGLRHGNDQVSKSGSNVFLWPSFHLVPTNRFLPLPSRTPSAWFPSRHDAETCCVERLHFTLERRSHMLSTLFRQAPYTRRAAEQRRANTPAHRAPSFQEDCALITKRPSQR